MQHLRFQPASLVLSNPTKLIGLDLSCDLTWFDFSRVLFLDIDGVMHPEGCGSEMNFCFAANFQDVLRQVDPEGKVPLVVSSAWRVSDDLPCLRSNFAEDIGGRIVGVTPYLPVVTRGTGKRDVGKTWQLPNGDVIDSAHREHEVQLWMNEHAPGGDWLALDDRATYFRPDCPNLFHVPGLYEDDGGGISTTVAIDLRDRMNTFLTKALRADPKLR